MMKFRLIFQPMVIVTMGILVSVFFTSCQSDEGADVFPRPISVRTPAPEVPAVIQVPEGHKVSYHTYAEGVQVYVCQEAAPGVYAWVFKAPVATLYANAGFNGNGVGIHYAGPVWESKSGSKVKAARVDGISIDPQSIPWLLLKAVTTEGPGIFENTTYIQRINTVGGNAPAEGATAATVGQEIQIPYTAEYYFYTVQ